MHKEWRIFVDFGVIITLHFQFVKSQVRSGKKTAQWLAHCHKNKTTTRGCQLSSISDIGKDHHEGQKVSLLQIYKLQPIAGFA